MTELVHFSPSCERNKHVILEQLTALLQREPLTTNILELGSYSGQHAIYFCQQLPNITWQPSDIGFYLEGLRNNLSNAGLNNCLSPIELEVSNKKNWPSTSYDIIYTANTLHIMSIKHVQALFKHITSACKTGTTLVIYGPFKYQGKFTSASNEDFELWLKDRDISSGIRDFEQVNELAKTAGFTLVDDIAMPANNQLLIFQQQ